MRCDSSFMLPMLSSPRAESWLERSDLRTAITAALVAALVGPALGALYTTMRGTPLPSSHLAMLSLLATVGGGVVALVVHLIHRARIKPQLPNILGSYRLERRLGQGGMGEVWRARHALLARPAAVKLIAPARGSGGSLSEDTSVLLARFEREVQATASLQSPHTVRVFDFGRTANGSFYYVMELLDGLDAQTLVDQYGSLPAGRAVHLLKQACRSLDEAHCSGLIHRDIKPANLFVSRLGLDDDFVKVLDFGLVKHAPGSDPERAGLTANGVATGTPAYMAPEVALGNPQADHRLDIYALGCVAYWLLTGQQVFDGRDAMTMALQHVRDLPEPPSQRSEHAVGPELDALILRCLAKDPGDRPQSARALHDLLDAIPLTQPWTHHRAQRWWNNHQGCS